MRRGWLVLVSVIAGLGLPAAAQADNLTHYGLHLPTVSGKDIPCVAQADGVRVCHGDVGSGTAPDARVVSFDGTPLEVYVIAPPVPITTPVDGYFPLIIQSHGWGSKAGGPDDTQYLGPTADQWAREGYAVLQVTARGFGDSCGTTASRLADPSGCSAGYVRLDDDRYEVRDVQEIVSELVGNTLIDAHKVGATGESYGGGLTLALATLKDRVMYPDGSLHPWQYTIANSPPGNSVPISLSAAAPVIPWSDLVASMLPNGGTLDTAITSRTADLQPAGVEKQSYVTGLFGTGSQSGYYAPPRRGPDRLVRGAERRGAVRHRSGPVDPDNDRALSLPLLPARRRVRRALRAARAVVDRQRVHRRSVPGRRGGPLRQPRAVVVSRRSGLDVRR